MSKLTYEISPTLPFIILLNIIKVQPYLCHAVTEGCKRCTLSPLAGLTTVLHIAFFCGLHMKALDKLQSGHNAAVCVLTSMRGHIVYTPHAPILKSLWQSGSVFVRFKIQCLVFKSLWSPWCVYRRVSGLSANLLLNIQFFTCNICLCHPVQFYCCEPLDAELSWDTYLCKYEPLGCAEVNFSVPWCKLVDAVSGHRGAVLFWYRDFLLCWIE